MNENLKKTKSVDNRIVLVQYICAVIVVLIHANNTISWGLNESNHALSISVQNFLQNIWMLAVPSFFFMSGFFIFLRFSPEKYPSVVKKRVRSLLVPYFLWNLIFYFVNYSIHHIPKIANTLNGESIPLSPVYFLREVIIGGGFVPLWYLRSLFVYTVFSIVFYYLLKNKYIGAVLITALIVCICVFSVKLSLVFYLPLFLTGSYFGMHIKRYEFSDDKKALKIVLSISILAIILAFVTITNEVWVAYIFRVVSGILFPYTMTSILKRDMRLNWIFSISLFIYCTHSFILQVVQKIFLIALGATNFTSLLCYFTSPVITISIITVAALILRRFLPSVWKIMNGGRKI